MIIKLVGAINDLLWGDLIILEFSGGEVQFGLSLLVLILIPAGLYFTFKTKFPGNDPGHTGKRRSKKR